MGTKYEKRKFLKQEASLRSNLVKLIGNFIWIELSIDIVYYVFYLITGFEYYNAITYPLVRILPICMINVLSFFFVRYLNNSSKYQDSFKNSACCIGIEVESAAVGIFHCYFTPLWVIPAFMVFFSFVFNESKLQWRMFILGCISTSIAAIYAIVQYEDDSYYAQSFFVSIMIYVVVYMVSKSLKDYNEKTNIMTQELKNREEKFRREL